MTKDLQFKIKLVDGVRGFLSCYRVSKDYQQDIIHHMLDNLDVFKEYLELEVKKEKKYLKE